MGGFGESSSMCSHLKRMMGGSTGGTLTLTGNTEWAIILTHSGILIVHVLLMHHLLPRLVHQRSLETECLQEILVETHLFVVYLLLNGFGFSLPLAGLFRPSFNTLSFSASAELTGGTVPHTTARENKEKTIIKQSIGNKLIPKSYYRQPLLVFRIIRFLAMIRFRLASLLSFPSSPSALKSPFCALALAGAAPALAPPFP